MKNIFTVCAAMTAIVGFSASASAQEVAHAAASATILTPISITKDADMIFGNVAVQSTVGGTVVISTAGIRSRTNGVTLPATTGLFNAASFIVNGEASYTYDITLPSSPLTITDGTNNMTVTDFISDPLTSGFLALGTQRINVGATLNVAAAQVAGAYASATPFDVTVNYN